jgi:hypothetical protein
MNPKFRKLLYRRDEKSLGPAMAPAVFAVQKSNAKKCTMFDKDG